MKPKRVKKMLLVSGALTTTSLLAIHCGPTVYANPKGCFYDDGGYVEGTTGQPCNPYPEAGADADAANPFPDSSVKDATSDDGDATAASDATADTDAAGD